MTNRRFTLAFVGAWLVVGMVALLGCRDTTLEDLPNNKQDIVQVPVTVYQMPDQFPNVVFTCNKGNGIYVTTRQANALTVVPDDPACAK